MSAKKPNPSPLLLALEMMGSITNRALDPLGGGSELIRLKTAVAAAAVAAGRPLAGWLATNAKKKPLMLVPDD